MWSDMSYVHFRQPVASWFAELTRPSVSLSHPYISILMKCTHGGFEHSSWFASSFMSFASDKTAELMKGVLKIHRHHHAAISYNTGDAFLKWFEVCWCSTKTFWKSRYPLQSIAPRCCCHGRLWCNQLNQFSCAVCTCGANLAANSAPCWNEHG